MKISKTNITCPKPLKCYQKGTYHYKKDCKIKKSPTRISIGHTHGMLHDQFEYIILQINTKELSSIFFIIELPHRGLLLLLRNQVFFIVKYIKVT